MALKFSNVTLSAEDKLKDFLVSGEPRDCEDLKGWTVYENFVSQLPEGTPIHAEVDTYLYGGEDTVTATPEEVAYLTMRSARDYRFLSEHCRFISGTEFDFTAAAEPQFSLEGLV